MPYAWKGRDEGDGFGTDYYVLFILQTIGLFHSTCRQFWVHSRSTLGKAEIVERLQRNEKSTVRLLGQEPEGMNFHSCFAGKEMIQYRA